MYDSYFDEPRQQLGSMTAHTWVSDPRRLGFVLARYEFVARMLAGMGDVAEVGCGDGFPGRVVEQTVGHLDRYDMDRRFCAECGGIVHDITAGPLPRSYDAVYALDVVEHIERPLVALRNMAASLNDGGVCIVGMPSLESQAYASEDSRADHVSCMTEDQLRAACLKHFGQVFLFGMNNMTLHVGFGPMAHYRLAVCVKL